MPKEFTEDLQKLFLGFLISDKDLYVRIQSLVVPTYFNNKLRPAVILINEHSEKYNSLPTIDQIKAKTGIEVELDNEVTVRHKEWFLDEFQDFAKFKALEQAILASADDIEKGEYPNRQWLGTSPETFGPSEIWEKRKTKVERLI